MAFVEFLDDQSLIGIWELASTEKRKQEIHDFYSTTYCKKRTSPIRAMYVPKQDNWSLPDIGGDWYYLGQTDSGQCHLVVQDKGSGHWVILKAGAAITWAMETEAYPPTKEEVGRIKAIRKDCLVRGMTSGEIDLPAMGTGVVASLVPMDYKGDQHLGPLCVNNLKTSNITSSSLGLLWYEGLDAYFTRPQQEFLLLFLTEQLARMIEEAMDKGKVCTAHSLAPCNRDQMQDPCKEHDEQQPRSCFDLEDSTYSGHIEQSGEKIDTKRPQAKDYASWDVKIFLATGETRPLKCYSERKRLHDWIMFPAKII
ncbi:hypothetical protein SELMODRAFT_409612 [Selaginella moellendorffii]|uniref:Uncharacterized protein n=1 Tax=Selaginella moellendorffii TaxID=88036 RepID=D8RC03_SELML|nr:hypothetical protein SELMODRAFT_409612 [Selaginella moellendorffii]